jgi:hypothetical protein
MVLDRVDTKRDTVVIAVLTPLTVENFKEELNCIV